MADEIMTAVAAALAEKVADVAFGGARSAWHGLVTLVRGRFGRDPAAAAALQAAQARPSDEVVVSALGQALERVAAADPGFAQEVRALWPRARAELSAEDGGTVNVNTGTVGGHLIQAGNLRVEGDLNLGTVWNPSS